MGWLIGYTLGSMAAALVVVRGFEALLGMRDAEKMIKRCRLKGTAVRKRIELLTEVSSITKGK
jgi:hypothetical protein